MKETVEKKKTKKKRAHVEVDEGQRVHTSCQLFDSFVELIPPKYYFPSQEEEQWNMRYGKNKKNAAPRQQVKEASKKAKKRKLDPAQIVANVEIQKRLKEDDEEKKREWAAEAEAEVEAEVEAHDDDIIEDSDGGESDVEKLDLALDGIEEEEEEEDTDEGEETSEESGEDDDRHDRQHGSVKASDVSSVPTDLHERLREKIDSMAKRRKVDPVAVKERRNERRMKKNRRQKARSEGSSSKEKGTKVPPPPSSSSSSAAAAAASRQQQQQKQQQQTSDNLQFSKINFATRAEMILQEGRKKRNKKSEKEALRDVMALETKKAALKGTEEGKNLEEDLAWSSAAKRALGEKVKDDPRLLKKTLQRKRKEKEKSAKEWARRNELQASAQAERQRVRAERIAKHKEEKGKGKGKSKGKSKGGKKPKVARAGFEGRGKRL